jgi:hypothetical protein
MTQEYKVGDHVSWDWASDHIRGTVVKVHSSDIDFKGRIYHASEDEPVFEVESDKTEQTAIHKGSALKKADG